MASSPNLHCGSCSEYFTDPRLLPCLHVFCSSCLESVEAQNEGTLVCPTCYTTSSQPSSTLPKHIRIEKHVHLVKMQESGNETVCGSCDQGSKAEAYCEECESPICSSCVSTHQRLKALKNHTITSLDSAKPQATTVMCLNHSTSAVKYYCCDCEGLMCSDCIINHKNHALVSIDEAAKTETEKLKLMLPKFECSIKPISRAVESINEAMEDVIKKKESVQVEVEEAFKKILVAVEKRRSEIQAEVNTTFTAKETRLQIQKEELEKRLGGLTLAFDTITVACSEYSTVEVLAIKGSIQQAAKSILASIESVPCAVDGSCPEFIHEVPKVDDLISSFGKLCLLSACASLCGLIGIDSTNTIGVASKSNCCLTLQTRNSKGEELKEGQVEVKGVIQTPTSFTEKPCKIEVCSDGKYNIIFSTEDPGHLKLLVTVDGVAVQGSPYSIYSFSYADMKLSSARRIDSDYAPQYAAWGNVTGSLYVTTNEGHVLIYNKTLTECKGIAQSTLGSKNLRGILVDETDGVMLLASSATHSLIKADLNGKVIMSIGDGRGSEPLQFQFPTGLCKTKQYILVGDCRNKRVQLLNKSDLTYCGQFDCRAHVWGVSVDGNGFVHVGTTKSIEVFKIEGNDGIRVAEYGSGNVVKAGSIVFPNYQYPHSIYSLVTDCADEGEVMLYNWPKNELIHSFNVGDHPLGMSVNQNGLLCVCCYEDKAFRIFGDHRLISY